jgi:hypothetical protein
MKYENIIMNIYLKLKKIYDIWKKPKQLYRTLKQYKRTWNMNKVTYKNIYTYPF